VKIDDSIINETIRNNIAADVLKSLDDESREKIISTAVADVIDSYKFRNVMDEEIKNLAVSQMREMLKRGDILEKIHKKAEEAVYLFVETLDKALLAVLLRSIDTSDRYARPDIAKVVRKMLNMEDNNKY
jgi:hypothetical protein